MWQEDGDDGGGGFDTSAQFQNFGGGEDENKQDSELKNLLPVTVRQALGGSATSSKIGQGKEDKPMVKIIGIVKTVVISSVKAMFTVEDDTGSINAVSWFSEDENNASTPETIMENTYSAVYGAIQTQTGSNYIVVVKIRPITDFIEITSHMLEVIFISLDADDEEEENAQPSIKHEMASSYGNHSEKFTNNFGLDLQQQKVYKAVSQCPEEGGATVEYIASVLTTKMPNKEISKIIEFLVNEGHVYSSIDDFHFKSTESTSFD